MTECRSCSFGVLFKSGWHVFKSNYGVCLGFGLLYLLLLLVLVVAQSAVGLALTHDQSSTTLGHVVVILLSILIGGVLITPVMSYLLYRILRRIRGDGAPARSGRYGMLVAVGLLSQIIMVPALVTQALGNPDEYLELREGPTLILQSIALEMKQQQIEAASTNEEAASYRQEAEELRLAVQSSEEKAKSYQGNKDPMWESLSAAYSLIGGLILVLWIPWAAISIIDPRENVSNVKDGLSRGWQLASSGRLAIIGVYVVMALILGASICAFVLPGIFLGIPWFVAIIPAIYCCLRGERVDAAAEPVSVESGQFADG